MKKVAFTLGLAFFTIGLFAQNGTVSTAKPVPTTTMSAKKDPAKTAPAQHAQQASVTKPASTAVTAKSNNMPAAKAHVATASSTPASNKTASNPTKKKHRARHHKKPVTPASGTEKSAPAPKKN